MTETIVNFFINLFNGLNKNALIFIVSMLPIVELRGGLIAASILHVEFIKAFIICFIGNILPVPFILLLIEKIFDLLKKWKPTKKLVTKIEDKTYKKKDQITKYGYLGLLLFVGIPLPGTGAWTGTLLAVLLNLDKKKSFIYISLGVLLAGIIMSIISYGILGQIF